MGNFIGVGSEITVSTLLEQRWKPFTSLAVASDDGEYNSRNQFKQTELLSCVKTNLCYSS